MRSHLASDIETFANVLCEQAGGVLWVKLNRTRVLNAIDSVMAAQLREVWSLAQQDPDVHTIVLSAAGVEAFCIGFDRTDPPKPVFDAVPISPKECGVDKRVIVTVNGIACRESFRFLRDADMVIAAQNASFFEPCVTDDLAGRPPLSVDWGSAVRTLCGDEPTMRNPLTALQAQQRGLVREVVPLASLRAAAARLVEAD
ncbi:enoyl-CoA hydratase/isomerase family protein [Prauserella flavalba]|nr:enoyl-CoA hydratase-related protein [Prauserella flavalba]